jgi:hypothetical protein
MEPVEMSRYKRHRGCWDTEGCLPILGEFKRGRRDEMRLFFGMLVVAVALLTLPAALLMDDSRTIRTPFASLAQSSAHVGSRGRGPVHSAKKPKAPTNKMLKGPLAFTKSLTSSKEKLLLNLLGSIERPCTDACTSKLGVQAHRCHASCRVAKAKKMKHLIVELDAEEHASSQPKLPVSQLNADAKALAATTKKIAHGNIKDGEKLVHWAEQHGLQHKVADKVLALLDHEKTAQDVRAHHAKAPKHSPSPPAPAAPAAARARGRLGHKYLRNWKRPAHRKLVEWAVSNGLPEKLAANASDKAKVMKIIARMKAESVVRAMKNQFRKDDETVGDIVHTADPESSRSLFSGLDYK